MGMEQNFHLDVFEDDLHELNNDEDFNKVWHAQTVADSKRT